MYSRILVPIDGSTTSMRGLAEAIKVAKFQGAALEIMHVVNETIMLDDAVPGAYLTDLLPTLRAGGQEILAEATAIARSQGVEARSVMIESLGGRAAEQILAQAKQCTADLIVMGTHGRRGWRRVALGSDAELVLRGSPVPLLLIRDPVN